MELPFLQQVLQRAPIERLIHRRVEPGAHLRPLAVADGVEQQIAQRPSFELQLPEHVEHLAAERLPGLLQLLQQPAVDVALAGLAGDQVPQVADLGLADPVDAAEALLQPVRVPGQVVVDHQVGALQVDALARRVGRQQHLRPRVVPEGFLRGQALLAAHAAVDDDDRILPAEQRRHPLPQVAQRVAVLGEDHELLPRRGAVARNRAGAVRRRRLADPAREARRREDVPEQTRQLAPLRVPAPAPHLRRQRFEPPQGLDLGLQLGARAGGGRLVENARLRLFGLRFRRVVELLDVVVVELRRGERAGRRLPAAPRGLELAQAALQPLAPPAQRPVDRFRRRGEPPLEHRQRETDGARPSRVGQRVRPVELAPHVAGDRFVEAGLLAGQPVGDGVGDALREQRPAVEPQQPFLDHAPHQVRDVGGVDAAAEAALEAVAVEQGQEELEVLLLAVVRGRR